jgi:hypothetical protein
MFFNTKSNTCSSVQAAAYGLPIVATKNGGPVDIHRVCPSVEPSNYLEGISHLFVGVMFCQRFILA